MTAIHTTKVTVLELPWLLFFGSNTGRVTDALRARTGNLGTTVAYRFAQCRTDRPGAWSYAASTRTTNGSGVQDLTLSGTTDQLWIQFAVAAESSSGAAEGWVDLDATLDGDADIVAMRELVVQPDVNSGEDRYVTLSEPLPALGLTGLMFVVIAYGVAGTIGMRPAWRTFGSDVTEPDAWTDLDTSQNLTTNTDYNSGTEATAPGTKMFYQPGLKLSGTTGRGNLRVIVAAKR